MLLNDKSSGWNTPQTLSNIQDSLFKLPQKLEALLELAAAALEQGLKQPELDNVAKVAEIEATSRLDEAGVKQYAFTGNLAQNSAARFVELFDYANDPQQVVLNFGHAAIQDRAGAGAISKVIDRYHQLGKTVVLVGLDAESYARADQAGVTQRLLRPVTAFEPV
jgi:anti-anti-sigma regulatory factor